MKKIAIIGSGGAGKSTLARKLGEMLKIQVYHLDSNFWQPGWIPMNNTEWDEFLENLIKENEWIIDGNYSRTIDIRFAAADTIIFLDMPRYLTMYRIFKRRIMYHGKVRPDMSEGCQEKIDWEFINWVWQFNKKKRQNLIRKIKDYSNGRNIVILQSPSEVKGFLKSLIEL